MKKQLLAFRDSGYSLAAECGAELVFLPRIRLESAFMRFCGSSTVMHHGPADQNLSFSRCALQLWLRAASAAFLISSNSKKLYEVVR